MAKAQLAATAAVTTAEQIAFATPADWWVLPLDEQTRDRRIAQMVRAKLGNDDATAHIRIPLIAKLRKYVRQAAEQRAFFAALQGRTVKGLPVAATFLASWLPKVTDEAGTPLLTVEEMQAALSPTTDAGEVLERSTVELPVGHAFRVRRRSTSDLQDRDRDGKGSGSGSAKAESLDFFVPMPQSERTLTMVFSTPILPLADMYVTLFDTMAATVTVAPQPPDEDMDR